MVSIILTHAAVVPRELDADLQITTTLHEPIATTLLIARQTSWPESDWAVKPSTFTVANPYNPPIASTPALTPTSNAAVVTTSAATAAPAATTTDAAGPNLGHAIHRAVTSVPWWGYTLGAIGAVFIIAMVILCLCCRNRGGGEGNKGAYEPAPDGEPAGPA